MIFFFGVLSLDLYMLQAILFVAGWQPFDQRRNQWGIFHIDQASGQVGFFSRAGLASCTFTNGHWNIHSRVQLSWYFSIASLVGLKLVKKKITRKMKKKSVKLDHFPMDRGEKLKKNWKHHPIRKRSWPHDSAIWSPTEVDPTLAHWWNSLVQFHRSFVFFQVFGVWVGVKWWLWDMMFFFVAEGWCNIYNTPRKTASVKLAGLSVTLTGTSSPESVSQKKKDVIQRGYMYIYIYIYNSTSTWRSFLKLQPFQISLAPHTILPSSAWSEGLASPLWWELKMMIEI